MNATAGNADGGLDPTRDFCVMKYQAKVATSNNGGQSAWEPVYDGNKAFTMANYWPQSRADSTPWVNISRDDAADRCKALNEAHGLCSGASCYTSFDNSIWGYRLISNTHWQVMARNLENTGANWTTGTVNSGFLWRGHSDDTLGTSPAVGTQELRTRSLSNGITVWDFGGNVWQWVLDNNCNGKGVASTTPSCTSDMGVGGNSAALNATPVNIGIRAANTLWEYTNGSITASDLLLFSSSGNYTSLNYAGKVMGSTNGAVQRGGDWSQTLESNGLFAAGLNRAPSYTATFVGFRCAFQP